MGILDFFKPNEATITEIKAFQKKEAIILDVRTPQEFEEGHIDDSRNIALQTLNDNIEEIKSWNKPIIACCKSGVRSNNATNILNTNNVECINGGGWLSLKSKLENQ